MATEPTTVTNGVLHAPLSSPDVPPQSTLSELHETLEEQEAFRVSILAYRDEVDRATGFGKYAEE